MNKTILWVIVGLIVIVGVILVMNANNPDEPADTVAGQTVAIEGEVLAVDRSQIAFDGPVLITVDAQGDTHIVAVPSMGLPLCAARGSIVDTVEIEEGDEIEARGLVGDDGSIVPCEDATHYLRVTEAE